MSDNLPADTTASSVLFKASLLNHSQCIKCCFFSMKSAGLDRTTNTEEQMTPKSVTVGIIAGRSTSNMDKARPDNQTKMLRMISALAELHKIFNSALSSQIRRIPHGNSTLFFHLCGF